MSWQVINVVVDACAPATLDCYRPTLLVLPATREGEEMAGWLSATLGGEPVGRIDAAELDGAELIVRRAVFGGRVRLTTRHAAGVVIATSNAPLEGGATAAIAPATTLTVETVPFAAGEAPLEGARLVIGGGRGLDMEDFERLRALAQRLGGALGGSLPAVDLGLVPVSRQIGQSGKFVTPMTYLAVGVSGTPQHLAGIGGATRIIAINKDPGAPIFAFAQAGAVGDAKQILPRLLTALSREQTDV
jgi:electron transfer flavoprotein alpha subunit